MADAFPIVDRLFEPSRIDLGYERLFDDSVCCGVELTPGQLLDPENCQLSTQQTNDFLANLDDFPEGPDLEDVLSQFDDVVTSSTRLYGSPKGAKAVQVAIEASIPKKTREQTNWTVRVWSEWAASRNKKLMRGEQLIPANLCDMAVCELDFWLSRFVLEIRKVNGDHYPPNSLYQIVCGLQRYIRENGRADLKLLDCPDLHGFNRTLDSEMKRLNTTGKYIEKRQAQPITVEQEKRLWEMGLLGDTDAKTLLSTVVFEVGFFFALRSGNEHRRLRHSPSQMQLFEPPGNRAYIVYREDVSKTNQGGLSNRKKKPKEVYQYANEENPSRCFVRLYKLYNSKCPPNRPANAFYLTPLVKPRSDCWYSRAPLGHNMLANTVCDLMKRAGFEGYFTNHSLRASLATRLFDAEIDEQLIMSRTGHSSTDGVRAYKRTSEKLKIITSDVLNASKSRSPKKRKAEHEYEPTCKRAKEKENQPIFNISGGSNITIHLSS